MPTIGVDVGGTKCLGVLWSSDGVGAESRRPTPHGNDPHDLITTIVGVIRDLEEVAASEPLSVGIGMPGLVTRSGVVRASPNLTDVSDLAVRDEVGSVLGRPVLVDNDATCAAVAEWRAGAGRGVTDMVMITLGTGIGAGIVANGAVLRGAHGFAGEIGHMVIDPDGPWCPCGQRGCWERFASGSALQARADDVLGPCPTGRWQGQDVAALASEGNGPAREIFTEFAQWVARGIVNVTNILDPALVVLGGGVVRTAPLFLDDVRRHVAQLLYAPNQRDLPAITVAHWDERAGAVGAALLAGME
ncbi:MAG: ROK family protein [Ilumatobacteraceae bacterium]